VIFLKQFRSHVYFTLIQVISLSIGFTVCIVLFSTVLNDLGYDRCWKGEDQLYRISMEQVQDGELSFRTARSYRGLTGMLEEELPEVTASTRLMPDIITVFAGEHQIQDVKMFYADTNVFEVLPRRIIAAESNKVFPDIHSMAISASLAKTLYGRVDCLGEEMRLNEGWTFYISTVFEDIPEKSHLAIDVLLTRASLIYYMRNFDNMNGQLVDNNDFVYTDPGPYHRSSWNNIRSYNYARVKKGTDMMQLQRKSMELIKKVDLPDRISKATIIPFFQDVSEIHLHSDYPDEIKENSSIFYIYMLVLIGFVVLLVCWINFINLFAVVFNERILIMAIRMVHGAGFREILLGTFCRGCVISLVAAAVAAGSSFLGRYLSPAFVFDTRVLVILLFLVIISALLSMLIPLISFRPGRIMSQRPDIPQRVTMLRNEMAAIPGVDAFCTSSTVPGQSVKFPGISLTCVHRDIERETFVQRINVDMDYFGLYRIDLLAGRGFRNNEHYDVREVVLNRQASEDLGFSNPSRAIGEMIRFGESQFEVVGIVNNYHHLSLKDKLQPIAFFKSLQWRASVGYYSFKLNSADPETLESIAVAWKKVYPGEQFLFHYMEETFQDQYRAEQNFGNSFMIAALLAILTACLGLLGLTSFNILERTKEIGIRKTFGSSSGLILKRLQRETFFLVILAAMAGIPISWFISRRWLDNFHYRIDPAWWMFTLAFILVLLVAVATTLLQTWKASRKNPVEALRYE